jgi:septal ring factor EnvC (AmiA/AmiB activator)
LLLPAFTAVALADDSVMLNIDETGEALSQAESALDETRRVTVKLGVQVNKIKQEVLRLRRELVDGAAEAQNLEVRISALEATLETLTQRRGDKRAALLRRRDELTQTFAALQRVGRTPPDLLIFMPASIQDISRARLLLGAVAGQLDARAASLGEELRDLARMGEKISIQRELIDGAVARLETQRARLGALLSRKTSVQDRTEAQHSLAIALVSRLADDAENLQDLLGRLEQERFNRPPREAELTSAPVAGAPVEAASATKPETEPETESETATVNATEPATEPDQAEYSRVESAPSVTLAMEQPATEPAKTPGTEAPSADIGPVAALTPARPSVSAARGAFAMPARGEVVSRFDETTTLGLATKGIIIETRARAQIVAPFDGRIAFAGPFREYGLLLIIDHGEGYHTLLAGMARIDVVLDQHVLAGEPVGVMNSPGDEKPRLYVELRKKGHPINPLPWLAAESIKVSG